MFEIVKLKKNNTTVKDEITNKRIDINKINNIKKITFISFLSLIIIGLFILSFYLLLSRNKSNLIITDKIKIDRAINILKQKKINAESIVELKNLIKGKYLTNLNKNNKRFLESDYKKEVLFISNFITKNKNGQGKYSTDTLYNILLQIKTINITIIDPIDLSLHNKTLSFLKKFDLVILDVCDAGYDISARHPQFTKYLIQYLNEGGALFSGHDQFDNTHKRYITQEAVDMLKLLGFNHINNWGVGRGNVASFNKPAINNTIFLVNYALYGDYINIDYTHQTYSRYDNTCKNCKVIMRFGKNNQDIYEFLVINRPNSKGRTVNIRTGHTNQITEQEKKIILSSFLWLLYDI